MSELQTARRDCFVCVGQGCGACRGTGKLSVVLLPPAKPRGGAPTTRVEAVKVLRQHRALGRREAHGRAVALGRKLAEAERENEALRALCLDLLGALGRDER